MACAEGDPAQETAIALLSLTTGWLGHRRFIVACVCRAQAGRAVVTWVDWGAVVGFVDGYDPATDPCAHRASNGLEGHGNSPDDVALLAAEIAGAPTGRTVIDLLAVLDPDTFTVALDAIVAAAGESGSPAADEATRAHHDLHPNRRVICPGCLEPMKARRYLGHRAACARRGGEAS
jgi:hypothetical protein